MLALAMLLLLVVFLLLAALVLDWAWLALVQRNMQHRTDLVALAATPALLDEDLLRDAAGTPTLNQADDLAAARQTGDEFRLRNNAAGATALRLTTGDVAYTPGIVDDVHASRSGRFGVQLIGAGTLCNSVHVTALRQSGGANPVGRFLRGFWNAGPVDVASSSQATLDNRVVGFRPATRLPVPLVPLAISSQAWADGRTGDAANGNGINELVLKLPVSQSDGAAANAALVGSSGTLDLNRLAGQITSGIAITDLSAASDILGPATPSEPLVLPATRQVSASVANDLAWRLEQLAAGPQSVRAFPIYQSFHAAGGSCDIVGFVAARVLSAEVSDDRLQVTIEPAFLIHPTVETVAAADPLAAQPNLYLHKLRLSR